MQQKQVPLSAADAQLLKELEMTPGIHEKTVCSGHLVRMELAENHVLRYYFEDGQFVEAFPLFAEQGTATLLQLTHVTGLVHQPVRLEIVHCNDYTILLPPVLYEAHPASSQEQPILTAARSSLLKDTVLVALVFAVILFVLLYVMGMADHISMPAVLLGWMPPAAIVGAGLCFMLRRYQRYLKSIIHRKVVQGIVTEKLQGRIGKLSYTWYRIGPQLFPSTQAMLAEPGQPLQLTIMTAKDGSSAFQFNVL
ncbi:ABC transporter ATP-binding protein [Chitinophaga qingshengii]|uniref:ABC transporter ATP-binding protein n=1 Tax=Chitinophaga qingshengii TaxID=1569794 RepID=A0ABR7TTA2_9BACT|nr:ABC transporter ATP-binding protein [Chitinophaga qingshengii]MBC9933258.1 ABC transporter ATP-binding protein [Chitinophaga qingshengii]